MANLNIGCSFSGEHINTILVLNALDGVKHHITDVYGSPGRMNPFGSVRPLRREHITGNFHKRVYVLNQADIRVNLTLNSLMPCRNRVVSSNIFDEVATADYLSIYLKSFEGYNMGLIVSHPGLLDWLHTLKNWSYPLPITISTIMNVHRLGQLQYIKERWPLVTKVCPALWKNRDFAWLTEANEIIPLELLANEFCSIGGIECEGLYRQACYLAQSLGLKYSTLPICMEERKKHPEAWLMARFILPQWMDKYKEETGVENFKITGRTHSASFIKDVGTKYIRGKAEGNLLALWGQLEATVESANQVEVQKKVVTENCIPIEIAERLVKCISACSVGEGCGRTCTYCSDLMKE